MLTFMSCTELFFIKRVLALDLAQSSLLSKKTQRTYVWLAVNRNRNKIVDIVVSKRRDKSVFVRIYRRLQRKSYKIKILCTNGYEGYSYYRLGEGHLVTKSETSLV